MRFTAALVAGALAVCASANKNYLGFNSGATKADYSAKFKADYEAEFRTAQALQGAPGKFNAVRLYTNIQAYSQEEPIEAFEAAINTKTHVLLGIWTSGTNSIAKEINALKKAVSKHGTKFTDLVIGISIGSEDLYRNSKTGIKNKGGVGNSPDAIVRFVKQFKQEFSKTSLAKVPVGHVDTWDAWTNSTNKPVIDCIDWLGVDEYPSYQSGENNNIKNAAKLFDEAYQKTLSAAGGKPVWVTETGWPVSGLNWDQAVASVDNAKHYWNEIGCRKLFNKVPTFWYNLRDSNPDNKLKFAITKDLSTKPIFDLKCPTKFETKSRSASESYGEANSTDFRPTSTGRHLSTMTAATSLSSSTSTSGRGSRSGSGAGASSTTSAPSSNAGASVQRLSAAAYAGVAVFIGAFALP
ncbi:glycosyl hydrolases family 17 domain-containing protein [Hirsutella rhossiliensis]|uniref:Glycosyl hydrolases family 17 domain-containing protein n=1 Tax=Hirsutella rhossiliensis TaxID=111463 RepID=A0A9P8N645_9HYPO|nr:glycosyl hydrolases family 17 domain-containing protein [Hirsutella rhossiliensis]KAH0967667.1 glycosyl hydrolases family 17 domain-containing protein [Hirsutella rhossiliensis]